MAKCESVVAIFIGASLTLNILNIIVILVELDIFICTIFI